ncbi:hypothetical protein H0H93_014617 [Arthromyces matolae]|nr:hypothetical protein H0H93_014617 [Arthromyces matolae]
MVLFFAVQVLSLLIMGPQAVLSSTGNFSFSLSDVVQCEPVSISFLGNSAIASPAQLTLVPFNAPPVSLPISDTLSNGSVVNVTFVPFAAGTRFLASLDDANGNSLTNVSDVLQVLESGNASCLPASTTGVLNNFLIDNSTFSQCEDFTLQYNRSAISHAPTIRLFHSNAPSLQLNLTSDDNTTGEATYLLSFYHGKKVVLTLSDDSSDEASSLVMTVNGDSSSPTDCLINAGVMMSEPTSDSNSSTMKTSMLAIIGASIGGGVVVLIGICVVVFIIRERRRRRQREADLEFNPVIIEKGPIEFSEKLSPPTPVPPMPTPTPTGDDQRLLRDPPYTRGKYTSTATMSSWSQPPPDDLPVSASRRTSEVYEVQDNAVSFESLDIEGMLNMASVQSSRTSNQTEEPAPYGSPPTSPRPKNKESRRHIRDPSSMASAISLTSVVDPFTDSTAKRQGQVGIPPSRQNSGDSLNPSKPFVGLPVSPRPGTRQVRERTITFSGVPEEVRQSDQWDA